MVRVTCVLLVALVCSLTFVARADPVDELLNVEGAVQGDEQNIKDCRTFPGARDAVLNLDARCGQTLNEQTWTSVVGGHRLSVSGLKINRDATCPSVYFQRSPRTIPLNIGPSRFPALTIEVLARPRSFTSAPYNWLVSGDSGNWGRSIVLRDPRMDGVSPAVGFFNPRFGLGRARSNRWIHLVSTFENNVESITYRNFFLTTKYRPTSPEGNNNLYIGGSQWGGHSVDADIAWVRVYADRLNADEVKQLFLRAAPCVASQCTSKPGQRAYGGGFGGRVRAGSVQDHIFTNGQTYIITADANECKLACAAHADCRTYVFAPSRACYRFTTGDLGSQPQAGFESGTCA